MSAHPSEFDEQAPEVFDFLEELERDRSAGNEYRLGHYLARYAGFEEAISAEFLAQQAPEAIQAHAPAPAPTAKAGKDDIGPYRVEKELGRGGQGVVYLAEDTRISRRVALKVLPPAALLLSADRKARLRREAEVISLLEHPGICGIYDAEISGDIAYLAMHFVEGETLGQSISSAARERAGESTAPSSDCGLPLFPENEAELFRVLEFFEEAARAMHAAHEAGVVHRDIKPGNLMVTPTGQPVWLDFGQARDTHEGGLQLTMSGDVFGTPAYMSPEQLTGHRDVLDPRLDVWALAVTLFEALTLERPFEGATTHALLFSVQTDEPRSARALNPAVTDELEVVLQTGLEKVLERRYATAGEFADELARIRGYEPIHARPASTALKFRRWYQRHPLLALAISGFIGVLILGLVTTTYLLRQEGKALEHALGRHLAERAATLAHEDPAAALALGIEAVQLAPSYQTRSALYAALERCFIVGEFDGDPARRFRDIALSFDGARLAAVLSDGSSRLYEVSSHAELWRKKAHEGDATAVAFAPDGSWFASGGASGRVVIFEATSGEERFRVETRDAEVSQLAVVEDGQQQALFVAFLEGEPLVLRASDGAPLELRERPEDYSTGDAGARLLQAALGGEGPEPWLDERAVSGELQLQRTHPSSGLSFVSVERDGAPSWELYRGMQSVLVLDEAAPVDVMDAAFSPDGARLAVAGSRGGIRLFDVASGRKMASFGGLLRTSKLLWTPDGEHVVAQTIGASVQVWFGKPRPDVFRLFGGGGGMLDASFSGDGERAVTLSAEGHVRVWGTPSASAGSRSVGDLLLGARYPGEAPISATLSPSGELVVACGESGVWLARVGEDPEGQLIPELGAHSASFTSDGAQLLVVGERAVLIALDEVQAPPRILGGPSGVQRGRLSPDGVHAVVASEGAQLAYYDCTRGVELWHTEPSEDAELRVEGFAFRPDGLELAVARSDRSVRFHELSQGARSREPLGVFPPLVVDWSADASRLLVAGPLGRGALMVKELATEDRMRKYVFHRGNLTDACFSPDGSLVMTSSEDGTIFVRDVLTGRPNVQLTGDGGPVRTAAFSGGDGELRVIAALEDGSARVWPVDPLPGALARKPRELYDWEVARESRLALPLEYR